MNEIPIFAIAGEPNVGKSTVVATLAEDDAVEIARRAGTTKVATRYAAKIGEETIIEFIDLPGFENTGYLRDWFEQRKDQEGDLSTLFVTEHENQQRFSAECEILKALGGVAVLFVVDAEREVQQKDRDQAEILRLCTDKRMAIINAKGDDSTDAGTLESWKEMLGKHFTYKTFYPHRANFRDRIELLDGISHVIPGWRDAMCDAITHFKGDWNEKRVPNAADEVFKLLEKVINIKETTSLKNGETAATEKAQAKIRNGVRNFEEVFRKNVRDIFRHRRADWKLPENDPLDDDIFSKKVWQLFGLNKKQLIWAGAATGLVIGAGIDLMVGGFSFFLGAVMGGAIGAAAGWLAADRAVDVQLPGFKIPGVPWRVGSGQIKSDEGVEAQVKAESNLIWILLDRALLYIQIAAEWSHGRRDGVVEIVETGEKRIGATSKWSNDQRRIVIQWVGALRSMKIGREKMESYEGSARQFFLEQIQELTGADEMVLKHKIKKTGTRWGAI